MVAGVALSVSLWPVHCIGLHATLASEGRTFDAAFDFGRTNPNIHGPILEIVAGPKSGE